MEKDCKIKGKDLWPFFIGLGIHNRRSRNGWYKLANTLENRMEDYIQEGDVGMVFQTAKRNQEILKDYTARSFGGDMVLMFYNLALPFAGIETYKGLSYLLEAAKHVHF